MVIVAVILVGTAGTQSSDSSSNQGDVLLGLGFIILAQAVTACQFIAEESLMNNKVCTNFFNVLSYVTTLIIACFASFAYICSLRRWILWRWSALRASGASLISSFSPPF